MNVRIYLPGFFALLFLACARIEVVEIKFNHNTASWSDDALNIRQNFANAVNLPEWTSGETSPQDSPAAYVGNRSVKIMARLKGSHDGVYEIERRRKFFWFRSPAARREPLLPKRSLIICSAFSGLILSLS